MPEKANIKTQIKGQPALNKLIQESKGTAQTAKKRGTNLTINLQRVIKAIQEQPYDEDTKKELIKMASRCPQGGLLGFMSSLSTHVASVQRARIPDMTQNPMIVSQKRQQSIHELEQQKHRIEKPHVENIFYDNDEPIAAKKYTEIKPEIKPQIQPKPKNQPPQQSREDVVAGMDARRAFAKRLQDLEDSDEPEEWLK
jgi:hypothetical protein